MALSGFSEGVAFTDEIKGMASGADSLSDIVDREHRAKAQPIKDEVAPDGLKIEGIKAGAFKHKTSYLRLACGMSIVRCLRN